MADVAGLKGVYYNRSATAKGQLGICRFRLTSSIQVFPKESRGEELPASEEVSLSANE